MKKKMKKTQESTKGKNVEEKSTKTRKKIGESGIEGKMAGKNTPKTT